MRINSLSYDYLHHSGEELVGNISTPVTDPMLHVTVSIVLSNNNTNRSINSGVSHYFGPKMGQINNK